MSIQIFYRSGAKLLSQAFGSRECSSFRPLTSTSTSPRFSDHPLPRGYWAERANRIAFFDFLGEQLNMKSPSDWEKLSLADIRRLGGGSLLNSYYKNSITRFLVSLGHFDSSAVQRRHAPGHWDNPTNQLAFFESMMGQLGLDSHKPEDWYKVTLETIRKLGGSSLLQLKYKNSPFSAISANFPHLELLPWKFSHSPSKFWKKPTNILRYLSWLSQRLDHSSMEDWYRVRQEDFEKNDGGGLLAQFDGSPSRLLIKSFPEHTWVPWKFAYTPQFQIFSDEDLRTFMTKLQRDLMIDKNEDWYRVSKEQIRNAGGEAIVRFFGGLVQVMRRLYPDWNFDPNKFREKGRKKSSQRWLFVCVKGAFPLHEVVEDHSDRALTFDNGGRLELDVFVPQLNIAFEYQGRHHYEDTMMFGLAEPYKVRDVAKARMCAAKGIDLIRIPFWWKGDLESLYATINKCRPNLIPKVSGTPIPDQALTKKAVRV